MEQRYKYFLNEIKITSEDMDELPYKVILFMAQNPEHEIR